jgi:hypothetical protein
MSIALSIVREVRVFACAIMKACRLGTSKLLANIRNSTRAGKIARGGRVEIHGEMGSLSGGMDIFLMRVSLRREGRNGK